MGIRSALFRRGASVAKAVSGAKTVARSSGANTVTNLSQFRRFPSGMRSSATRPYRIPQMGRPAGISRPASRFGSSSRMAGRGLSVSVPGPSPIPAGMRPGPRNGIRSAGARPFRMPTSVSGGPISRSTQRFNQTTASFNQATASDVVNPGRMRRMGAFAKRHPLALGGAGIAVGYRMGSQDTGPAVTTTNTTGVYGM